MEKEFDRKETADKDEEKTGSEEGDIVKDSGKEFPEDPEKEKRNWVLPKRAWKGHQDVNFDIFRWFIVVFTMICIQFSE